MKLIYKGKYKNEEQLPKGVLPSNAVKFIEPDAPEGLASAASRFILPALLLIALFVAASFLLHGELGISIHFMGGFIGILLSLLTLFPHELLHAVFFGKESEVELYIIPNQFMAFVYCNQPVTKKRFIVLSLFPNVIFGWLPLLVWVILPYIEIYSNILFVFSFAGVLHGIGDYLNVYNASRQMPKGSMQQLSGFNSYWFMPHDT